MEEFNYEPQFPIAVVGTRTEVQRLMEESRLSSGKVGRRGRVDFIAVEEMDVDGQETMTKIEQWLDEIGV